MSDQANDEGKFTVSARQLIEGNFVVFIDLRFGKQKLVRLTYRTHDPSEKVWLVSGLPEERSNTTITVKNRVEALGSGFYQFTEIVINWGMVTLAAMVGCKRPSAATAIPWTPKGRVGTQEPDSL